MYNKAINISISDYTYDLNDEKIAKYPLDQRDQSRLLVWKNNEISDDYFFNIHKKIPANSLLIFNNTKVIRARIHFFKESGAKIEIFCLDPMNPIEYQTAFQSNERCTWNCMIGNLKKWKGERLRKTIKIDDNNIELTAEKIISDDNKNLVEFKWNNSNYIFSEIIEAAGILPIPPYLNRETEDSDLRRYQTVYSKIKGSVAAPTAGLHFTDKILRKLIENGHKTSELTLHVGAGTFQPVKSKNISGHQMHQEHIYIEKKFIKECLHHSGPKIAVGTTAVRTLESIYQLGVQAMENPDLDIHDLKIEQWEAYSNKRKYSTNDVLSSLYAYMEMKNVETISAITQIIIVPGYDFKMIDGMITNFHQSQSTLLLLVSAFVGDNWKTIYNHALENDYRFLSYGDSNLYLK